MDADAGTIEGAGHEVWADASALLPALARRRPGRPRRPGAGDDPGAVARRAGLPAARPTPPRTSSRRPGWRWCAGATRSRTPVAVGGWLTTTARREAWRVGQKTGRDIPVEDQEFAVRAAHPALRGARRGRARRAGPALAGRRHPQRAVPAAAAHRRLRAPPRLQGQVADDPGHAHRQHRPHPEPLSGQATRRPRETAPCARGDGADDSATRSSTTSRRCGPSATPCPTGLVERMQAVAAAEVTLSATDLDYELMLLVERSTELVGTRGTDTAYTLRFGGDDLDLLVRAGGGNGGPTSRLDGWIVPPAPITVRASEVGGASAAEGGPRDPGRRPRALRVRGPPRGALPALAHPGRRSTPSRSPPPLSRSDPDRTQERAWRPRSSTYRRPDRPARDAALDATRRRRPSGRSTQVEGRVLDPSTALVVPGVKPMSTVYVGPRLHHLEVG